MAIAERAPPSSSRRFAIRRKFWVSHIVSISGEPQDLVFRYHSPSFGNFVTRTFQFEYHYNCYLIRPKENERGGEVWRGTEKIATSNTFDLATTIWQINSKEYVLVGEKPSCLSGVFRVSRLLHDGRIVAKWVRGINFTPGIVRRDISCLELGVIAFSDVCDWDLS